MTSKEALKEMCINHELAKAYIKQEDHDYCSRKLGYNYTSGYRFFFSDNNKNTLYRCKKNLCNITTGREIAYTNNDLVSLDPSLKYLVAKCGDRLLTMDDIKLYRDHPELKRVLQSHLRDYAFDPRLYKLKKPTVAKLKNYFGNGGKEYLLNDILAMVKFGCDYEKLNECRFIDRAKKKGLDKETAKYLFNQEKSYDIINDYNDYIKIGKLCGFDTNSHGFRFPKNFRASENEMLKIKSEKEDTISLISDENLNAFLKAFKTQKSKFSIFIPQTRKDLIHISNELSNCVGKYHKYGDEMLKGKPLICVVCLDGKMIECCEFDLHKKKIIQLRGEHNQPSDYHTQCQRYINKSLC